MTNSPSLSIQLDAQLSRAGAEERGRSATSEGSLVIAEQGSFAIGGTVLSFGTDLATGGPILYLIRRRRFHCFGE